MEEPDLTDSDGDDQMKNKQVEKPITEDSDSPYTDSDSEGDISKKSMLHVHKVGHVPGKYKVNRDAELPDNACSSNLVFDNSEHINTEEKKPMDESLEAKTGEGKSDLKEQELKHEENPNYAESGIFEKSMLIIPSIETNEDITVSEDTNSEKIPIQQELTLTPNNDSLDQGEKRPKRPVVPPKPVVHRKPVVSPKPSPRKSKCLNKNSDKIDCLAGEMKSHVSSPKMIKKVEDEKLSFVDSEQQFKNDQRCNESSEHISGEKNTPENNLMGTLDNKIVITEEEVDTVDIGSADDCACNIQEKNEASFENKQDQTGKQEQIHKSNEFEQGATQFKKSVVLSSFEVIDDEKTVDSNGKEVENSAIFEDSASDTESSANFVNDLKDADSDKSDVDNNQETSESEPEGEFLTPDNQSLAEKEDEIFYDSNLTQSTVPKDDERETLNEENYGVNELGKENEILIPEDETKEETVNVKMKIKAFEESVVVIGKGSIKECEYESMSSIVYSDDLKISADWNEGNGIQSKESNFGSIHNRISMFENKEQNENKDSSSLDFVKTGKSCSSSSSFDVLTRDDSEDSEMKSDVISASLEDIVMEESHGVITNDIEKNMETITSEQYDSENNLEDSFENERPPPIPEKSEKVLESMQSMFVDIPDEDDRGTETAEASLKDEITIDDQTSQRNFTDLNNENPSQDDLFSNQQNFAYQQQQQYPNMQYDQQQGQFQQQQQFPYNQPYNYYQGGNYQYPYAFYNPNMNPGLAYQNQEMQYFQQPYFSQPNFGMPYSYAGQPNTEMYRSQSPSSSATNSEETGQQTQKENLMTHNENNPNRHQSVHTHHKEVSQPNKSNQRKSAVGHDGSKLSKSKSDDYMTKVKSSSPTVKRSVSLQTKHTPVARKHTDKKKKDIEMRRQTHKEGAEKEYQEIEKIEDYYVYFKGINPKTISDNLSSFVEITTGGDASDKNIVFNYTRTCALVTVSLAHKPDLGKIKERIRTRGLDSKHPEVFEAPKPTKIAVSCEEDINNKETLDLYFESRKAQGKEGECVELKEESYESEDGSCFVLDFGDVNVVKRICAKGGHEVEGKALRVSPYFECEGGAIWNSEIHVLKVPDSINMSLESSYVSILRRQCCADLIANLKESNCSLEFTDDGLLLHCTLSPKMTGFKGLAKQWAETSTNIVQTYISEKIMERKMKSTTEVWNELIEFFNSENIKSCEEVVAVVDSTNFVIHLTGFKDPVIEVFRKLEGKQLDIEKQHRRRTETIGNIDDLKLRLLKTVRVFEDLEHNLPDIKIDIGDGELTVEGQPEDISEVRVKLLDLDNQISHKQWNHQFSRECVFFVNNVLTDQIYSILKENNITAVWKMDDNKFDLFAFEDEVNDYEAIGEDYISSQICLKAEQILKTAVVEMKEPVQDSIIEVLTSPEWISFSEHITETFENTAELEVIDDKEILVHGLRQEAGKVHGHMKDFLDKNAIISDTFASGTVNIRFIKIHRMDFVARTEKKLEEHKVKIELRDDSVKIRGNRRGILEAKKEFNRFFDGIVCDKYTIQKVAVRNVFKDQNEQGTIEKIERDTSCLIKIPGENATFVEPAEIAEEIEDEDGYMIPVYRKDVSEPSQDGYGQAAESSSPVDPYFTAQNGVKVHLVRGELGQQDANVIVVTTSPNLNLNSGSACKSVLREGGPQLQSECKEKYPNEIKFGEIAVINGGGNLECNKVYLTTLPNWNSEHNPVQVLEKVMKDSLELADKYKKFSIVFCAMGTGQLQYPTETVARLMYQAVIDFDQSHPQSSLKEVKFVLYQKDFATIKAFEEEEKFRLSGGSERPKFELKSGKVTIELLIENIAQQKVDGILCSTSPDMELNRSGACQALVRIGGKTLQDECKSKYGNKLEEGNVAEIGGGKLSCKSVYLTVLPAYSADTKAIKILTKVIQTLLQLAQAKGYKSLALPALGTGFLRYPKNDVCQCMFQTVIDWVHDNPSTSITTVKFIMHAKDHKVIDRFRSYILNERGRGRRDHRRFSSESKQEGARPKRPSIDQPPKRPDTSFYNAHADGIQIGKVKLSVFKDDILTLKKDAIVSSVGKDFAFIGAVAQEIKNRCPKMEEECKKQENVDKLNKKGVFTTKGYQLPVKHVIHVKFAENIGDWQERFYKCLEAANKKHLKSIAFPVLGTGKGFKMYSPEAITGCLFDALNDFVLKTKHSTIKEVLLIVYHGQPGMYKPIMDKLQKKVQEAVTTGSDGIGKVYKAMVKLKNIFIGKEEGLISKQEKQKLLQETSSLDVMIYSDSKANIERCKKELEAKLEESYMRKKIEDYKEIIKTLTPVESDQLEITALANINIDSNAGIVTVEGPTNHVTEVMHLLKMRLLKIERQRHDIASAEELYKLVQWQYEEVTEKGFEYTVYEKGLNQKIENAYKKNMSSFEFEDNDGETFVIDFNKLTEYKKSDDQDRLRVVRKDILKAAASALPKEWADMKDNENIKVVSVPSTDKEYQDIENRFITEVKTGSYTHRLNFDKNNLKVNKIERIQNRTLYQQYQAKMNQMKELKPNLPANFPIERELWHGTKSDAVTSIQIHGFNRSYSGNANGPPWYGEGVYFAANASYSARGWLSGAGAGNKGYMFVVKTLTGELCKGQQGMRYLPQVDPKDPTRLYDCAVDNLQNPMEFVIFNDTQAYPAYIITFTT